MKYRFYGNCMMESMQLCTRTNRVAFLRPKSCPISLCVC